MAITVKWDNGDTETWEAGASSEQLDPRGPFMIRDAERKLLAYVPDFGVRFVTQS